jgi:hypothetical protein
MLDMNGFIGLDVHRALFVRLVELVWSQIGEALGLTTSLKPTASRSDRFEDQVNKGYRLSSLTIYFGYSCIGHSTTLVAYLAKMITLPEGVCAGC